MVRTHSILSLDQISSTIGAGNYTLEHNSLIDLERGAPSAPALRELIELDDRGIISVQLVAVGASEKLPDKSQPSDYALFEELLIRLGLAHLPVLFPLRKWGLTYWGHDRWGDNGGPMEQLLNDPIAIMAPASRQLTEKNECDVLSIWTHIYEHGDVFVTRDKHFLRSHRKQPLERLGAGSILTPEDALTRAKGSSQDIPRR